MKNEASVTWLGVTFVLKNSPDDQRSRRPVEDFVDLEKTGNEGAFALAAGDPVIETLDQSRGAMSRSAWR